MIDEFKSQYPDYQVIFLHVAGSKLYGTNLPSSDTDYRGIFIPSLKDIIVGNYLDHWTGDTSDRTKKNTADDIDITLWSIQKFVKLLSVGDTNAFDTLFAFGTHAQIYTHPLMSELFHKKIRLYPKSLRSFFGYALGQVRKYSVKGDRLHAVKELADNIHTLNSPDLKIKDVLDTLPKNEHLSVTSDDTATYYKVLDKRFIVNITLGEFYDKLKETINSYGARAQQAKEQGSVDWKAMYHAFRVIEECKQLMLTGHINFPLDTADFLIKVRTQQIEADECFALLEQKFDEAQKIEISSKNLLADTNNGHETVLLELLWKFFKLGDA
jgi:predicted nucleotidyltransferase